MTSNQFYHRLMVMLIRASKAGVEYDPSRVDRLASSEFSDLVEGSIISNMDGILDDLKSELDNHVGGEEAVISWFNRSRIRTYTKLSTRSRTR